MTVFQRGLIVSCQALKGEPLYGDNTMVKMAKAAELGGAIGLRLNGVNDIVSVSNVSNLPKIGILKRKYEGFDVFITPTKKEVDELIDANPEVIALDCTNRSRAGNHSIQELIKYIKRETTIQVMADIATLEEGIVAQNYGVDFIGTTLSGYTSYTENCEKPNILLVRQLAKVLTIPIIAEGNYDSPSKVIKALDAGAYAVVVGAAITRPQIITEKFTKAISAHVKG